MGGLLYPTYVVGVHRYHPALGPVVISSIGFQFHENGDKENR